MLQISITGLHVDVTDSIRNYVHKRLRKIENHFRQPATVDVILHKENASFLSEATIHGRRLSIHAKSVSYDMLNSIDGMSSKLDRQIIKHKEMLKDHGRHIDKQRTIRNS